MSVVYGLLGIVSAIFIFSITMTVITNKSNSNDSILSSIQERELKELNVPYKCECGIVSRKYQLLGNDNTICSHCESDLNNRDKSKRPLTLLPIEYKEVTDDREFPFAPKMDECEYLKMYNKRKYEQALLKEKNDLIETDKEIQAWEKLAMKKLEEYERKADELRKEMGIK